jgi:hypothetical protein
MFLDFDRKSTFPCMHPAGSMIDPETSMVYMGRKHQYSIYLYGCSNLF